MPTYSYEAKKISGEEIKGTRDARDKFDLARALRQEGYMLVSSTEARASHGIDLSSFWLFSHVSIADKMIFARNTAVMIDAGLSLARALDILGNETKSAKFKTTLNSLAESIKKGTFLSEAMKQHPDVFSTLFVSMVKAGEEGGSLSEAFRLVAHQLESENNLMRKIRGALVYPAVIVVAMIIIGILMLIYVVPTLVSTFNDLNIDLPTNTKLIIYASDFIVSHVFIFLAGLAGTIWFLVWCLRTAVGRKITAAVSLRLPVIGPLVQKVNAARTARTLGSLIGSGVDILKAIDITKEVLQNERYKNVLDEAKERVRGGNPVSEIFKQHHELYPVLVGEMIAVGEETGKLSDMLFRLADFYEEEVANATKDLSTIIEPLLMIVIGAMVGFFAISMIQPLYSSLGNL